MKITVSMLVREEEKRKKYKRIIGGLLYGRNNTVEFLFYADLNELYKSMINNRKKADILILQASLSNFEFANELRKIDRNCIIIYPAKDMTHILEAFESMPMAYVVAGSSLKLSDALKKAAEYLENSPEEIYFETKSRMLKYSLQNIDYFESRYRIVDIVEQNGATESITSRLDDVEARLPASFFRCHQSFLVNMDNIKSIDKSNRMVYFNSGQSVPSSKNLFTAFLNEYRKYKNGGNENV